MAIPKISPTEQKEAINKKKPRLELLPVSAKSNDTQHTKQPITSTSSSMAAAASNSTTSSGLVQAVEAVKAKFDVTLTTNISWRDLSEAGALALDLARRTQHVKRHSVCGVLP